MGNSNSQIATKHNDLFGLNSPQVWDTELAFVHLQALGEAETKRTAERRLNALGLLPKELAETDLRDELDRPLNQLVLDWALAQARKRRDRILFAQLSPLPGGQPCLHANDARGARYWIALTDIEQPTVAQALTQLQQHIGKPITVLPHGALACTLRNVPSTPDK